MGFCTKNIGQGSSSTISVIRWFKKLIKNMRILGYLSILISLGGPHSTVVAFALLTQRLWVRIPALLLSSWALGQ